MKIKICLFYDNLGLKDEKSDYRFKYLLLKMDQFAEE